MVSNWSALARYSAGNGGTQSAETGHDPRNDGHPWAYTGLHESTQPLSIPVGATNFKLAFMRVSASFAPPLAPHLTIV
jgi:hypothetical protein